MAISLQQLTIYLYSAHRAVIFAIAQLSCNIILYVEHGMCVAVLQWKCLLTISKWTKVKTWTTLFTFFTFLTCNFKNVKSRVFWILKKNVKTYSQTVIVTTALSLTIRPQFAIECLRRSDQQRVGHFRSKFWGFSLWDVMLGTWAVWRERTPQDYN